MVLPSESIGFLGLLPIVLGIWKFLSLVLTREEESENITNAGLKSVLKVSSITIINDGDKISTYILLFSQATGAEIAVYVVTYYILLGIWCFLAFAVLRQKQILRQFQKYADVVIPFLYLGLGIYIVIKSDCYPWSIDHINNDFYGNPGKTIVAVITACLLLIAITFMLLLKLRERRAQSTPDAEDQLARNPLETLDPVDGASKAGPEAVLNHPNTQVEGVNHDPDATIAAADEDLNVPTKISADAPNVRTDDVILHTDLHTEDGGVDSEVHTQPAVEGAKDVTGDSGLHTEHEVDR